MTSPAVFRYRLTFAKADAMRFTGHLDLWRAWARTLRRARLPIAYTEGYHPHPRFTLAVPLPLGLTASEELAELWLEEAWAPERLRDALDATAPPGLRIGRVEPVDPASPAVQREIVGAEYEVVLGGKVDIDRLRRDVDSLLEADRIRRERRGRTYDLRPLIESIELESGAEGKPWLRMRLAARPGATGRPDEVLSALGLDPAQCRTCRRRLVLNPRFRR